MAKKKIAPIAPPHPDVQVEPTRVARSNPTVFISHDGRDADLAEAFCNLLTDVSGGILKPFCSLAQWHTGEREEDRRGGSLHFVARNESIVVIIGEGPACCKNAEEGSFLRSELGGYR